MARSILFLVGDPAGASVRFRVAQYLPLLESAGWRTRISSVAGPLASRLRCLRDARDYDRVVVHRLLLAPAEAWLLRRAAPRYVFDFDDALMVRDSAHTRQLSWQRRARLWRMIRGAGAVTVGNRHLAEWVGDRHPKVSIVPTAIDLAALPANGPSPEAVIGWMGTRSNLMYLRTVLPALAALGRQRPGIRLKVVCDGTLEHPALAVENKRWALADEPDDLRTFQIGIMPLPDDPWTRGKCGGKLLQYLAAGLPVVCSPVGANRDIVVSGASGLFATTTDEWCAALCRLIDDASLRQRLGAAGRDRVEREYSLAGTFPKLLAAIG